MQTQSKYQYQPFDVSGKEVRFHWDIQSYEVKDDPDLHWKAQEALCLVTATAEEILQALAAEGCSESIQQELIQAWNNK